MPGARPESSGPVCAVTAWRASTSVVGAAGPRLLVGRGRRRSGRASARGCRCGGVVTVRSYRRDRTGALAGSIPPRDRPADLASRRQGLPETVLDPEPADALARARDARSPRPTPSTARRRVGRRGAAGPASSTAGPGSVSSPATTSRRTRASGSATTGASTGSGSRAGGARATCAGSTRPTAASSARSTGCARAAAAIGEADEEARCAEFLHQLEPGLGPDRPRLDSVEPQRTVAAMKRALITGITGQDGRYLAEFLAGKGYQVFGLDPGPEQPEGPDGPRRDAGARAGRRRPRDLSSLIAAVEQVQPDEVYNLGAISFVHALVHAARAHRRRSPASACCACSRRCASSAAPTNNPIRFYQASSSEMFGKVRETPQNELTPFHPRSPYGVAKVFGHHMTVNYREAYGLHASSGILLQPRVASGAASSSSTRKITNSLARIKLGLQDSHHARQPRLRARLGLRRRLRRGDVADAPAGRARRLRDRHRRDAHHPRVPRRRVPRRRATTTGRRSCSRTRASSARPRSTCSWATRRRRDEKLGWTPKVTFEELVQLMYESDLKDEQAHADAGRR